MRRFTILFVAVLALSALAACGNDDDGTVAGPDTEVTTTTTTTHEMFDFGEPADAAAADRTIDVEMFDELRYEPDSIEVAVGETVAFRVHNSGQIVHEFVLGSRHLQEEHEQEMQEMDGGMMMHDEPNAVAVEPGATKTLAFHFTGPATLEYACHEPGHYDAGMKAPLTVS